MPAHQLYGGITLLRDQNAHAYHPEHLDNHTFNQMVACYWSMKSDQTGAPNGIFIWAAEAKQ